jgi:hypothetical protein
VLKNNPGMAGVIQFFSQYGIVIFLVLLIVAVGLILMTFLLRKRLRWTADTCPKCGAEINRAHRRKVDYAVGILVPHLRRYSCSNPACHWRGNLWGRPHVNPRQSRHEHAR